MSTEQQKRKINGLMAVRQARLRNSNNFLAYIFFLFNQAIALIGDSRLEFSRLNHNK